MRIKTWMVESALAAIALSIAPILHRSPWEAVGAVAVLLSFMHGQIADRHGAASARRERAGAMVEVSCWRWSARYFAGKEIAWVAYFVHLRAWSALVGCGIFLVYSVWRRWHCRRTCR